MNKSQLVALLGLAATAAGVQAQEVGRVLSSTPVIQQVAVPRQVCTTQPMAVQQPNSGAGGVMGAIAGGALGSQIGGGSGRGVATVLGVVGGAVLGNRIEGSGAQVQNVQQCSTQTFYENRTAGYNVVYEFAGKQYQTTMPQDPGPTVRLQVTPVGTMPPVDQQQQQPATAPMTVVPQPMVSVPYQGVHTVSTVIPVAPQVVVPQYYAAPRAYYPPISLHLGYVWGGGHRHHGHGHRRWH